MLLRAHISAGGDPKADQRTVVIHSQFMRPDQLDSFVEYKFIPSFFTNHAFFWGDVHIQNLGKERAFFLSPMKSAQAKGLHYTNHSDYLVTPLNPLFVLWSAVARTSRSGVILGPEERVTPMEALKALTINGAYEYFEEKAKGSIEPGKLADLVLLEKNPLKVETNAIKEIKVVETFKEGKSVYKAPGN